MGHETAAPRQEQLRGAGRLPIHLIRGRPAYLTLPGERIKPGKDDKFNRVDILAEDSQGRLLIIEVQNSRELYYFHRILYGVAKTITEYINLGNDYDKVRKVYSINIVYFDLGHGKDYVYHGKTVFRGLHNPDDILQLSARQQEALLGKEAGDVFPEYYVLRVNDFDKVAKTPLDEWMLFLKTGEIDAAATAKGLPEARERLRVTQLSDTERRAYEHDMETQRYQRSVIRTGWIEGKAEGLKEGKAEGLKEGLEQGERNKQIEIARKLKRMGMTAEAIAQATGLSDEEIDCLEK